MLQTDRFQLQSIQKHQFLQPDCPVYVHCTRQSEDRRSGAKLLQLRMVNCGADTVETVVFDVEGLTASGEPCFSLPALVMTGCKAEPRKIFGDDRVFSLKGSRASRLRVTVRQVIFAGGISWKLLPANKPTTIEEAGWEVCACGMPNSKERSCCVLCGASLQTQAPAEPEPVMTPPEEEPELIPEPQPEPKPEPVVRRRPPAPEQPPEPLFAEFDEDDDDDEGVPVWLSVLLCVFGTLALLALLAFGAFFLHQYIL